MSDPLTSRRPTVPNPSSDPLPPQSATVSTRAEAAKRAAEANDFESVLRSPPKAKTAKGEDIGIVRWIEKEVPELYKRIPQGGIKEVHVSLATDEGEILYTKGAEGKLKTIITWAIVEADGETVHKYEQEYYPWYLDQLREAERNPSDIDKVKSLQNVLAAQTFGYIELMRTALKVGALSHAQLAALSSDKIDIRYYDQAKTITAHAGNDREKIELGKPGILDRSNNIAQSVLQSSGKVFADIPIPLQIADMAKTVKIQLGDDASTVITANQHRTDQLLKTKTSLEFVRKLQKDHISPKECDQLFQSRLQHAQIAINSQRSKFEVPAQEGWKLQTIWNKISFKKRQSPLEEEITKADEIWTQAKRETVKLKLEFFKLQQKHPHNQVKLAEKDEQVKAAEQHEEIAQRAFIRAKENLSGVIATMSSMNEEIRDIQHRLLTLQAVDLRDKFIEAGAANIGNAWVDLIKESEGNPKMNECMTKFDYFLAEAPESRKQFCEFLDGIDDEQAAMLREMYELIITKVLNGKTQENNVSQPVDLSAATKRSEVLQSQARAHDINKHTMTRLETRFREFLDAPVVSKETQRTKSPEAAPRNSSVIHKEMSLKPPSPLDRATEIHDLFKQLNASQFEDNIQVAISQAKTALQEEQSVLKIPQELPGNGKRFGAAEMAKFEKSLKTIQEAIAKLNAEKEKLDDKITISSPKTKKKVDAIQRKKSEQLALIQEKLGKLEKIQIALQYSQSTVRAAWAYLVVQKLRYIKEEDALSNPQTNIYGTIFMEMGLSGEEQEFMQKIQAYINDDNNAIALFSYLETTTGANVAPSVLTRFVGKFSDHQQLNPNDANLYAQLKPALDLLYLQVGMNMMAIEKLKRALFDEADEEPPQLPSEEMVVENAVVPEPPPAKRRDAINDDSNLSPGPHVRPRSAAPLLTPAQARDAAIDAISGFKPAASAPPLSSLPPPPADDDDELQDLIPPPPTTPAPKPPTSPPPMPPKTAGGPPPVI